MNEPELKSAAYALAEATPRHLNQPTTPPIHWDLEGDVLRVLMADGRTFYAPLADLKPKPIPRVQANVGRDVIPPAYAIPGTKIREPIQVPRLAASRTRHTRKKVGD